MSQQAARRQREIGLRKALGATDGATLKAMLVDAVRLALWGLGADAALSLLLGAMLRNRVAGIGLPDPAGAAAVAFLMLIVAIVAAAAPPLRASRITPMQALRDT